MLGTVLSILFLMWFLTGMVMMYRTYPSLSQQQRMEHAENIEDGKLKIEKCYASDSAANDQSSIFNIQSIEQVAGRNVCMVKANGEEQLIDMATGQTINRFSSEELQQVACQWTTATPTLIDTLNEIDVWLIGCMPFKEFPVYHYALNDGHGSELYLSSRTGRALQFTDSESRFWAWVGAIPHWIYIKQLRATGRQPWTDVVLWLSGFGIAMALSGIVIGIRSMLIARRRNKSVNRKSVNRKSLSPYVKPLFRWHHIFGLFFGFFVFTWIFSGFMSLADAPRLIWPVHGEHSAKDICADSLTIEKFRLDCAKVVAADEVKRLEWLQLGNMPFYHVWTAHDDYLVDAADSVVRHVTLDGNHCRRLVEDAFNADDSNVSVAVTLLHAYDNYYVSQKRPLPLPIWHVTVGDDDLSTYYINPVNGDCRYYNDNRRAGKWMYTGLHALNTSFFSPSPTMRRTILWLLLFGGTAVSLTGVLLTVRRIRKLKY